jgi:large subunit ribosomal protein L17
VPGTPRKSRRFGGDAAHQRLMMGNMVAHLIAAEVEYLARRTPNRGIVTTEAKAKALRPIAERMVTKAKKGGVARQRDVVAFIGDKEMAHKLFAEIAPRYDDRQGGYTRILKLGPRHGDNAPMARIEFV